MKRLIAPLLLLVMFAAQACAEQGWYTYSPPGSVDGKGILADVLSRCDDAGRRTAQSDNDVTTCHEATHMLNSRIRASMGGGNLNAFYCGGGRCLILPEPNTTLAECAANVTEFRNSTYQLYFIQQQRDWNRQPLYILDEFAAYLNGSQHANESGADEHGSHNRCRWFSHYADALVKTVQQRDPGYSQLADLTAFVEWQKKRTAEITGERPPQRAPLLAPAKAKGRVFLIDMPREYRERNHDGSCGYISVANCLRFCGLWREAQQFRRHYSHGCTDDSLKRALNQSGIKYSCSYNDRSFLTKSVECGRGAAVFWGGPHVVNFVGCDDQTVTLMGNNNLDEFKTESWDEFMRNHRQSGGFEIMILSGQPPQPSDQ